VIHLTMNQISAYVDLELPEASIELVRLHLSSCLECAERFGHLEEQEEALGRLLVNDPGDAFFAGFAEQVLSYMPERHPAPAKPERHPDPAKPERAAAPPPVAPNVRSTPPPEVIPSMSPSPEPAPKPMPESSPSKPGSAKSTSHRTRHILLAASLVLVLSAIAIVVGRRGMMDSPSTTWILDHLDPTSWFGSGNARGTASAAHDSDKAAPSPADSSNPYPTVVDSGSLDRAAAKSAMAESVNSPEAYDAAAEAWSDALPILANDPEELASGRREVASARYVAWSLLPTPERRAAALEAVRTYLLVAPPGAQRDLAWKWLSRLKR
jgi:hypothetical protein